MLTSDRDAQRQHKMISNYNLVIAKKTTKYSDCTDDNMLTMS